MARRFSTRVGKVRRQTQWDALPFWTEQTFSAPGEAFIMAFSEFNQVLAAGPVPPPTPLTITRTILNWTLTDSGTNNAFYGAIGMCVVTQDALDQALLGIKSVPVPVEDAHSDVWFLHEFFAGVLRDSTAGTDGNALTGQIISKGQRKIDDGQQIVVVVQRDPGTGISTAGNFTLAVNLRALVKVS